MKLATVKNLTEIEKLHFMKFVYDNTDSYIMNTFGHVWSGRDWWDKFPIQLAVNEKGEVLGLHAYTVNDKKPKTLKTYYIVTNKKWRGKGIARLLILKALEEHKEKIETYYVNTDKKSDGVLFFLKMLGNKFKRVKNDFNSEDYIFEEPVYNILDEATKKDRNS
jgi:GNAT superfamily N-acetyltransferase